MKNLNHYIKKNSLRMVKKLVERRDFRHSKNPFLLACKYGHSSIIKYLYQEKSIIPELVDLFSLSYSTRYKKLTSLKTLESLGFDLFHDNEGFSLLHQASRYGSLEIVKYLLEKGITTLNSSDNEWEASPLKISFMNGRYKVFKYLIEYGAEITPNIFLTICRRGSLNYLRLIHDKIENIQPETIMENAFIKSYTGKSKVKTLLFLLKKGYPVKNINYQDCDPESFKILYPLGLNISTAGDKIYKYFEILEIILQDFFNIIGIFRILGLSVLEKILLKIFPYDSLTIINIINIIDAKRGNGRLVFGKLERENMKILFKNKSSKMT